jgi:hypothetical protein
VQRTIAHLDFTRVEGYFDPLHATAIVHINSQVSAIDKSRVAHCMAVAEMLDLWPARIVCIAADTEGRSWQNPQDVFAELDGDRPIE